MQTNLKRYKEILSAFRRNGLGFLFLKKTILDADSTKEDLIEKTESARGSVGKRLRCVCEELGPAFIKLGQLLSTRTDMISANMEAELTKLQDNVPAFDFSLARGVIEEEFSDKLENIFSYFNETPVASASMAQVYEARLMSGDKVAVKVRRPGIEQIIDTDTRVLRSIARFIDKYTKYGEFYEFENIVREFSEAMRNEMDFVREAENTERIANNISGVKNISCPRIKWVYTTKKVLTMEFIDGMKISDVAALKSSGIDTSELADRFVNSLLVQMLKDGYFQADPHPGNEIIKEDGTLVFIDLGMTGELSETVRRQFLQFLTGLSLHNTNIVARSITEMGIKEFHINEKLFERDISYIMDRFMYRPLANVKLLDFYKEIQRVASNYKIKIPSGFTLAARCLGSAQSIVEMLDPSLNIITIAENAVKRIVGDHISSGKYLSNIASGIYDWADVASELPVAVGRFLRKAQEEDFTVDINIKGLDEIQKKTTQSIGRVTVAIILLAVSILMAGIIIALGQYYAGSGASEVLTLGFICIVIGAVAVVGLLLWMLISSIAFINKKKKK